MLGVADANTVTVLVGVAPGEPVSVGVAVGAAVPVPVGVGVEVSDITGDTVPLGVALELA